MSILIAAGVIVGVLLLVVSLIVSRIKVAGPNEAFIITGKKGKTAGDNTGQKVVMGASVFVIPWIQQLGVMDLSSRRIQVQIQGAVSATGIRCSLRGVAVVKVGGTEEAIRSAAQRFLDQQDELESFVEEILAGSLRAIAGTMSIEELIRDRAGFAGKVAEESEISLSNQGLELDTFQIQDIEAEGEYLQDLGRPEAARVQKDAAIAEATARQEAEQKRLVAEQAIAEANRTYALKTAEIKAATDAAQAEAEAAGPISKAAQDERIIIAQEQVAARQSALRESQLDTEVRKPADARRYEEEQAAEAKKVATILASEAAAKAKALQGESEQAYRQAIAAAVAAEGKAEAEAILAKGHAEAEALKEKAEAFQQFNEAAVLEMLVKMFPDAIRAASEPLSNVDSISVISTDGASALTKGVATNVEQMLEMGSKVLGIDLRQVVANKAQGFNGPVDKVQVNGDAPVLVK